MSVIILYHPESDHARIVETFSRDYKSQHGSVDLLSLETPEGAAKAELYGIVQYPAILAIREDGQVLKQWEGGTFPLMQEVAAYQNP